MKSIISLAIVLMAPRAFACPQLAGEYICGSGEDAEESIITQSEESGVTVYNVDDETYIADGQSHQFEKDGDKTSYKMSCKSEVVTYEIEMTGTSYRLNISGNLQKTSPGQIEFSYSGQFTSDGKSTDINESYTCKLK